MTLPKSTVYSVCILAGTLVFASGSEAQTADYFPLQIGNNWMYRPAGGQLQPETAFRTISVEGTETLNGRDYFRVLYFGRTIYLRSDADGTVVSLDRQSGAERPWLS